MLAMYFSTMPVILGGISNMIFCKTSLYKKYRKPIDRGKVLKDGNRLFGDNKTGIGFFSMIVFTIIYQIVFGYLDTRAGISELYLVHENTLLFNVIVGFLFGFAYMICELPNSFLKRRLGIDAGNTNRGVLFLLDQIDSMVGIATVILVVSDITYIRALEYVALGGITHIAVNLLLKLFKIRKNI